MFLKDRVIGDREVRKRRCWWL